MPEANYGELTMVSWDMLGYRIEMDKRHGPHGPKSYHMDCAFDRFVFNLLSNLRTCDAIWTMGICRDCESKKRRTGIPLSFSSTSSRNGEPHQKVE